jgi:hypothetical protein
VETAMKTIVFNRHSNQQTRRQMSKGWGKPDEWC